MGSKKGFFTLVLAALLLLVPASASAAPHVTASVTSVDFVGPHDPSGAFDPGDGSVYEASVTIQNTGDVEYTVVKTYFGDTPGESNWVEPDPFGLTYGNCGSYGAVDGSSTYLLHGTGSSCQFRVRFSPWNLANGDYTETLKVAAFGQDPPNLTPGNVVVIPLGAQIARNAAASVSTTDLDLGAVPVNKTETRTLTLTSTGTSQVFFSYSEVKFADGTYPLTSPFAVSGGDECNNLTPGNSCDFEVSFSPESPFPYEIDLWLYGNFGDIKVRLSGSGVDPPQAETTPNLRFGEKIVGSRTTRTASVTATSFTPINVDSAAISGPGASAYSVSYDQSSCQNLEYQSSCEFDVTYRPTAKGSHKASLKVNGDFGSQTINLSGSARKRKAPKFAIRIFGPWSADPGETVTLKAKIYNRGEVPSKPATLKTTVPGDLAGKVKPVKIKPVKPGKPATKTVRIKVKPGAKAGSRLKVSLAVSAKSAKTGKTRRTIRVK